VPRIRTIKHELFTNERCNEVSVTALLTFIGLLPHADDHGRHRDNAAIIGGLIWPMRGEHTPVHVEEDLNQLAAAGLICRYTGCDGKRYLHIVGWFEHQKIDKRSQSRMPVCTAHHADHRCGRCAAVCRTLDESSASPPGDVAESSPNTPRALATSPQHSPAPSWHQPNVVEAEQDLLPSSRGALEPIGGKPAAQEGFAEPSANTPRTLTEGSASGSRIVDLGSLPTGRGAPDAGGVSAKELISEYVASCRERPPGDVIAHLGRIAKKLLAEGISPEHVRAGLRRYAEIQGHPSRLPSLVNDAMNAPRGSRAGLSHPTSRPNLPAHTAWTNPADAAAAYAEEL
jgi:hypothetical protein